MVCAIRSQLIRHLEVWQKEFGNSFHDQLAENAESNSSTPSSPLVSMSAFSNSKQVPIPNLISSPPRFPPPTPFLPPPPLENPSSSSSNRQTEVNHLTRQLSLVTARLDKMDQLRVGDEMVLRELVGGAESTAAAVSRAASASDADMTRLENDLRMLQATVDGMQRRHEALEMDRLEPLEEAMRARLGPWGGLERLAPPPRVDAVMEALAKRVEKLEVALLAEQKSTLKLIEALLQKPKRNS